MKLFKDPKNWKQEISGIGLTAGFIMKKYFSNKKNRRQLIIAGIITGFLNQTKRTGYLTTAVLGVADGIYFILPILADVRFYDTWLPWAITQSAANIVLLFCLIK